MFQQADITLPARSGKSALLERTDSRVNRFSDARAKFQAAQAFQKETRCKEPPRRRSPSPGPRTEALVQNFTQLGRGGSSINIFKNNPDDACFKDVPVQTWRRSLPDCSRISTENKENSAQFNFSRSNDFLPTRPSSPLHSSYPRPVARVAPVSTVGGERVHGLHPAVNQDPPLPLELLPVNALPRTQDRQDQRRQRDSYPLEEEATTVPEATTLPETDSLQELVNDISLPLHSVHENA